MCGIVGYQGHRKASDIVYEGLKKLEYRGYDSAGIATVGNPSIKVEKGEGTIDEVAPGKKDGKAGIGHTRWATHGGVNDRNAHPHTDCSGEIAVVHNGIINNYEELREKLESRGHVFESETDTEVIPHLLEELLEEKDIQEAADELKKTIEGSYAVVAALESGEILAFKQDSPLAIGMAGDEYFLASDVTPFLEYTDRAVFLEDGDVAVLNGEVNFYRDGEEVDKEIRQIDWDAEQASKEGHDHFMEKEILEQSKTVKRAVFQDRSDMEEAVEMLEDAETVYLTGCGTASFAASLGAKYLRERGIDAVTEQSHELEYRKDEIGEEDLVIAVSQSGETADLLSTLKKSEGDVLAIVNVVGSTLARKADHKLFVNAGPEIGVASTKAFTAQVAVLKLLGYTLEGRLEEGRRSLIETAENIEEVLSEQKTFEQVSEYLLDKDHVFTIGRNKGYEMSREAALKLKELSYIHVEAFPGGEFKHGTLALIEEGVPVISFLDHSYEEIMSNTLEAKSRGADIIGVGSERIDEFEYFIELPEDENREILEIVPFQMIAYLTSVKKGNDPDKPRNLAKSVTVK